MPYNPSSNIPYVEVLPRVWPDGAELSLVVTDYNRFIEHLISLKDTKKGDTLSFTTFSNGKESTINIINKEKNILRMV